MPTKTAAAVDMPISKLREIDSTGVMTDSAASP
ncbi:Uncharacterised protein [Vibrio cholerae]|nr:Uncharacterised protein [Vibrio cholerae]